MITFIDDLRQFSLIKAIEFRRHKFFGAIGHYFQCPQAYLKSLEHTAGLLLPLTFVHLRIPWQALRKNMSRSENDAL